jgi:hypothetical protein
MFEAAVVELFWIVNLCRFQRTERGKHEVFENRLLRRCVTFRFPELNPGLVAIRELHASGI